MKKLLTAAVLSLSFFAHADAELKPAQEEAKEKFDTEVVDGLKSMNDKCGTKVTIKTDFEHFKEADWSGTSVSSYCTSVTQAIGAMCEARPAYKKIIAKKLTGVSCLVGGVKAAKKDEPSNAATQRNMSFDKGVFTYTMSPVGHANLEDNAKATLEKALN